MPHSRGQASGVLLLYPHRSAGSCTLHPDALPRSDVVILKNDDVGGHTKEGSSAQDATLVLRCPEKRTVRQSSLASSHNGYSSGRIGASRIPPKNSRFLHGPNGPCGNLLRVEDYNIHHYTMKVFHVSAVSCALSSSVHPPEPHDNAMSPCGGGRGFGKHMDTR